MPATIPSFPPFHSFYTFPLFHILPTCTTHRRQVISYLWPIWIIHFRCDPDSTLLSNILDNFQSILSTEYILNDPIFIRLSTFFIYIPFQRSRSRSRFTGHRNPTNEQEVRHGVYNWVLWSHRVQATPSRRPEKRVKKKSEGVRPRGGPSLNTMAAPFAQKWARKWQNTKIQHTMGLSLILHAGFIPMIGYHHVLMIIIAVAIILLCECLSYTLPSAGM